MSNRVILSREEEVTASRPAASMVDLLRVSILSLKGVQCSSSSSSSSSSCSSRRSNTKRKKKVHHEKQIISACVGFRSSSLPPESLVVPSSQYSTVFLHADDGWGEGPILSVYSEDVALPTCREDRNDNRSETIELLWNGCFDKDETKASSSMGTNDLSRFSNDIKSSTPHLEVELPSSMQNVEQSTDALEFHVCVLCTSYGGDDDTDSVDDTYCSNTKNIQPQICHGVAHLRLPLSKVNNSGDESTEPSVSIQQGGEVFNLPIRRKGESSPSSSINDIQLAQNATLSIRVERTCVPVQQHCRQKAEQYHYIESEWRREPGSALLDSIIHNADDNDVNDNYSDRGLSWWYRRATSTLTMAKSTVVKQPPQKNEPRGDKMLGKVIQFTSDDVENERSVLNRYQNNNEMLKQTPSQLRAQSSSVSDDYNEGGEDGPQSSKKSLSQTISERFLCGASFSDALKMAAAAGHHCDEDHVGLYVVNSESMCSSIATADVI